MPNGRHPDYAGIDDLLGTDIFKLAFVGGRYSRFSFYLEACNASKTFTMPKEVG